MHLGDVAEIIFAFPEKGMAECNNVAYFANAISFRENNIVSDLKQESEFLPDERLRPHAGDIIIRRVQPTFVNYINADANYYLGQNLIIIRPHPDVILGKYLAFVLENGLDRLHAESAGSLIPSLKRKDLECFDIGAPPPLEQQKAIGELWWLNKEKAKLQSQLANAESKFFRMILSNLVEERK